MELPHTGRDWLISHKCSVLRVHPCGSMCQRPRPVSGWTAFQHTYEGYTENKPVTSASIFPIAWLGSLQTALYGLRGVLFYAWAEPQWYLLNATSLRNTVACSHPSQGTAGGLRCGAQGPRLTPLPLSCLCPCILGTSVGPPDLDAVFSIWGSAPASSLAFNAIFQNKPSLYLRTQATMSPPSGSFAPFHPAWVRHPLFCASTDLLNFSLPMCLPHLEQRPCFVYHAVPESGMVLVLNVFLLNEWVRVWARIWGHGGCGHQGTGLCEWLPQGHQLGGAIPCSSLSPDSLHTPEWGVLRTRWTDPGVLRSTCPSPQPVKPS